MALQNWHTNVLLLFLVASTIADISSITEKALQDFIGIYTFRKVKVFGPIKSRRTSIGYIFHFCQNQLSSAYKLPKWSKRSCYDQNIPNRGQQTINIFKSYWRTTSYAVHFFYIFHLCKKNYFPEPINCLNCQSGLVMTKIYQTDANKPLIYSNYTGVRARTPCTFAPKNGVRARTPMHFCFIQICQN